MALWISEDFSIFDYNALFVMPTDMIAGGIVKAIVEEYPVILRVFYTLLVLNSLYNDMKIVTDV